MILIELLHDGQLMLAGGFFAEHEWEGAESMVGLESTGIGMIFGGALPDTSSSRRQLIRSSKSTIMFNFQYQQTSSRQMRNITMRTKIPIMNASILFLSYHPSVFIQPTLSRVIHIIRGVFNQSKDRQLVGASQWRIGLSGSPMPNAECRLAVVVVASSTINPTSAAAGGVEKGEKWSRRRLGGVFGPKMVKNDLKMATFRVWGDFYNAVAVFHPPTGATGAPKTEIQGLFGAGTTSSRS